MFARHGETERRKTCVIQARHRPARPTEDDPTTDQDSPWIGEGFTATKKVGNAVIRNRAKRRLRAAAQAHLGTHGLAGVDYVFIARHSTADARWERLLDDVESALISLAERLGGASGAG